MAATTALIVGVVREVISWPSYRLEDVERMPIPLIAGVEPGKHATRKGWLARAQHFPRNPFQAQLDERIWETRNGERLSLREIALGTAMYFRDSIRRYADPFSYRLLFSILRGETPSLLDLPDRPAAYDDVGRETRWGSVLPDLENFAALMNDADAGEGDGDARPARRRKADVDEKLSPPWSGDVGGASDRRTAARPGSDRRMLPPPAPSTRLTRSVYEKVFLKLGSGKRVTIGGELLTPVAVKGWYHSIFITPAGEERMLSIDQLVPYLGSWSD
jgi:hypothetical protein